MLYSIFYVYFFIHVLDLATFELALSFQMFLYIYIYISFSGFDTINTQNYHTRILQLGFEPGCPYNHQGGANVYPEHISRYPSES